ncbi:HU family DNA-binding protein [Prevotella sp.]|uniref:HU family DNA-binding protein n=1 Tax=Prevotella sp. TaxID=59823 RepID=UPI002F93D922
MAVNYKMYQDNRKESKTKGKWFARATHKGVVETNQLTEVMTDMLQQSMRIKLNGLGTFKIGISTRAAETAKDFTITKHLRNVHVLFQPELTVDRSSHARKRALLHGVEFTEADEYTSGKKGDKTTTTKPSGSATSGEEGGN